LAVLRTLKWYVMGLVISLPLCYLLALGAHLLGLSSFKASAILVFSSASFLTLVVAMVMSFRRLALPRAEALREAPEELIGYYDELRDRLSAAIWALLLLAISLLATVIAFAVLL